MSIIESEQNLPTPTAEPPAPSQTALVKSEKKSIIREKDAKGRFVSKKDKLSTQRWEQNRREYLAGKEKGSKKTRSEEIDAELFEMVKLGKTDPKFATAAVNAAKLLKENAHGRTAPSEKELDRLTKFPITMVIIPAPEMMHPEPVEPYENRRKPTVPEFIKEENAKKILEGEYIPPEQR